MTIINAAQIVCETEVITPGFVEFEDGVITAVSPGRSDRADYDYSGVLLPGFVDLHCHGGGGATFPKDAHKAAAFHLKHGTTTLIASLVSAPLTVLAEQIALLKPALEDRTLAGVHLEGPFLAHDKCGAQNPAALSQPNPEALLALIDETADAVRLVTIAPELPRAIETIQQLTARGIVSALGHSVADADAARSAIDAGATLVTHLFNAMPALDHRSPTLANVALIDDRLSTEIIADGVHVSADMLTLAGRTKGSRLVAVTDCIGAAGMPDGDYELGGLPVVCSNGVARLRFGGQLAGSTLTMDRAFATLTESAGLDLVSAANATATEPARVLGLTDVGSISVGKNADFVIWSDGLEAVFSEGDLCE